MTRYSPRSFRTCCHGRSVCVPCASRCAPIPTTQPTKRPRRAPSVGTIVKQSRQSECLLSRSALRRDKPSTGCVSSRVGALGDDDADADAAKSIAFVCADCMTRSGIPHYSCGLHAAHAIPVRIGGVESVIGATWLKAFALHVNTESSNTVLSLVRVQHPAHTPAHQHQELRTVLRMRWWYRMIWMKLALQLYMHFRDIVCADNQHRPHKLNIHLDGHSTNKSFLVSTHHQSTRASHC